MQLASICSGVGVPELAAKQLGFNCLFAAEKAPFPKRVFQHHFPRVKTYGDFTKINPKNWLDKIELLVAGTPCQSFSLAGKKQGLKDKRGNLTIKYIRLVHQTRTPWAVLENVPGIFDRDFGFVLDEITGRSDLRLYAKWPTAGVVERGASGYSAAWRVLDAQFFGVPQRRRRVFIVFHAGDWERCAEVLNEPEGGQRDIEPGGSQGEGAAAGTDGGAGGARKVYRSNAVGERYECGETLHAFPAMDSDERRTPIVYENYSRDGRYHEAPDLAPPIRSELHGHLPIVYENQATDARYQDVGETAPPLTHYMGTGGNTAIPIVMASAQSNAENGTDIAPTLQASERGDTAIVPNGAGQDGYATADIPNAITTESKDLVIWNGWLRYMTPTEAERCMGMSDGYTDIPLLKTAKDGKETLVPASKTNRYKAIGNSMAVPVMRWVLQRLEQVAGR